MIKIYFICLSGGAQDSAITGNQIAEVSWPAVPRIGDGVSIKIDDINNTIRRFSVVDVNWNLNGNAIVYVVRSVKHLQY